MALFSGSEARIARGAFIAAAIAACAVSIAASLVVWTDGASDPISKATLAIAAIGAELIVLAGIPVVVAACVRKEFLRGFVALVVFLAALAMSFTTALGFQAMVGRERAAQAAIVSEARASAETRLVDAKRALETLEQRSSVQARLFADELARAPDNAPTARSKIMEAQTAAQESASQEREQLIRERDAALAALAAAGPVVAAAHPRAVELGLLIGVEAKKVEMWLHVGVAILIEMLKAFGSYCAAIGVGAAARRSQAREQAEAEQVLARKSRKTLKLEEAAAEAEAAEAQAAAQQAADSPQRKAKPRRTLTPAESAYLDELRRKDLEQLRRLQEVGQADAPPPQSISDIRQAIRLVSDGNA
jgi:hypothetical protein